MLNKRKILYVVTQGDWGGAQRYIFDLATKLAGECEITVAVGEPGGRKDLQERLSRRESGSALGGKDYKIAIVQLKHLVRRISPWHDILAIFELARLYKQLKPDVVHLNSSKAGIIGSFAKKISNEKLRGNLVALRNIQYPISVVYTVHGWIFNEPLNPLKKKFYFWLEKMTAEQKDRTITLSPQDYNDAVDKVKIPIGKVATIPLGIAPAPQPYNRMQAREAVKKNTKITEGKIWVSTIAGYYKTKGLDILIKAIKLNAEITAKANFVIIGDGPEKPMLEKMVVKYGLQNSVHFLGKIDQAARLLPAFDIYLLPSRKEGLPYTILEAIQCRLPIIATAVGGVPSLIKSKENGLLVEPNNAEKLSRAILFGINNMGTMQKLAARLPAVAGVDRMAQMTKQVYG